jgi:hypothetical protein
MFLLLLPKSLSVVQSCPFCVRNYSRSRCFCCYCQNLCRLFNHVPSVFVTAEEAVVFVVVIAKIFVGCCSSMSVLAVLKMLMGQQMLMSSQVEMVHYVFVRGNFSKQTRSFPREGGREGGREGHNKIAALEQRTGSCRGCN